MTFTVSPSRAERGQGRGGKVGNGRWGEKCWVGKNGGAALHNIEDLYLI